MRIFKWLMPLFVLLVTISACKKDKDTATTAYLGTWRVAPDTLTRYWVFENNGRLDDLLEVPGGLRTSSAKVYKGYPTTIVIDNNLYSIRTSGDSLILTGGSVIVLLKATAIDASDWLGSISVANKVALPLSPQYYGALDWTGTEYLLSNFNKRIYKVTPAGVFFDSTTISTKSYGVCVHGGSIWTNGYLTDSRLRTINFATGATLTTSSAHTNEMVGNTSDGSYIWCIADNGALVYYNPLADVFTVKSNIFPGGFAGGGLPVVTDMAIKDGFAYCCSLYLGVFKIDLSTGTIVRSYKVSGLGIIGLAFKGDQLTGVCTDLSSQLFIADINLN